MSLSVALVTRLLKSWFGTKTRSGNFPVRNAGVREFTAFFRFLVLPGQKRRLKVQTVVAVAVALITAVTVRRRRCYDDYKG